MKFTILLTFSSLTAVMGATGVQKCSCAAEEHNFALNCAQDDFLSNSLRLLLENKCDVDCTSLACKKQFFIVQAHHDHCLHDEIPEAVETDFHLYEDACEVCHIAKKFDPSLEACPSPACGSQGNDAYGALIGHNCDQDCSTPTCVANYQILRSEHDVCPDGTLSTQAEQGIHRFEDACEASNCNAFEDNSLAFNRSMSCLYNDDSTDDDDIPTGSTDDDDFTKTGTDDDDLTSVGGADDKMTATDDDDANSPGGTDDKTTATDDDDANSPGGNDDKSAASTFFVASIASAIVATLVTVF